MAAMMMIFWRFVARLHRRSIFREWAIATWRRGFMVLLGGLAACPMNARAQAPAPPVIGLLNTAAPGPFATLLASFRQGLQEGVFVEGQNVAIEYRWAEGQYDRLPALAAQLVRRQVAVIAATGGTLSAWAAKSATATIPVVFSVGADPIAEGLVNSFSHPGGNLTGFSSYTDQLVAKRLELVRELLPKAGKIATLFNPQRSAPPTLSVSRATADIEMRDMRAAARVAGLEMLSLNASGERDFEPAFAEAIKARADALVVSADPFFTSRRALLVELAERHSLPTAYPWREYVEAGGLMSYGTSLAGLYRRQGQYVSRILKGAKPGDLPVQNPINFELAIDLTTAKKLGLTVPRLVLVRANELFEH
jgi:putative ABC transport system substrate-binding protein